jgi:hypothetical protein
MKRLSQRMGMFYNLKPYHGCSAQLELSVLSGQSRSFRRTDG